VRNPNLVKETGGGERSALALDRALLRGRGRGWEVVIRAMKPLGTISPSLVSFTFTSRHPALDTGLGYCRRTLGKGSQAPHRVRGDGSLIYLSYARP
jgi:hypothetical protein